MGERLKQYISWPGARAIESFSYTVSHGPSPGVAQLACVPRTTDENPPAMSGDLLWGDGKRVVRLRDCIVDVLDPVKDSRGLTWTLVILDRRWRWLSPKAQLGGISGRYNAPDPRAKLVPWSVRSPEELAELCFEQMGETNYEITGLPKGLSKIDGAAFDEFLKRGEQFKMSLANPPVNWTYTPPALALAALCETFGCRLIYQPVRDRVLIAKLGEGRDLPDAPSYSVGRTYDPPETPKELVVVGGHTRYQCRLVMEPVGDEWDGKVTPVDELSYKPEGTGTGGSKQVTRFVYTGSSVLTGDVQVTFSVPDPANPGIYVEYVVATDSSGDLVTDNITAIAALINQHPGLSGLTASTQANAETGHPDLILTGDAEGESWGAAVIESPGEAAATWTRTTTLPQFSTLVGGWQACGPPNFTAAKPTDRLAYDQARAKARGSVYSWYRIALIDPATGKAGLTIPGYGRITRRQQIILLPNKCAQLVPEPRNLKGKDRGRIGGRGFGVLPDYYDGYSRDQRADVYGSISRGIGSVLWGPGLTGNTDPADKIYVPFAVVPEKQMIAFSAPVWQRDLTGTIGARFKFPRIVLETAVLIMDADTSAIDRSEFAETGAGKSKNGVVKTSFQGKPGKVVTPPADFAGKRSKSRYLRAGVEFEIHDDVQVDVIATYTDRHAVVSVERDESDARPRADHYLAGMRAKHQLAQRDRRSYPGILALDPDGKIQQVSWSIGGGPLTTASTNSEHSTRVPPYPARRRAENLPPDATAALANIMERYRPVGGAGNGIAGLVGAGGILGINVAVGIAATRGS